LDNMLSALPDNAVVVDNAVSIKFDLNEFCKLIRSYNFALVRSEFRNQQLQAQMASALAQDHAYESTFSFGDGKTWTRGKRGEWVLLADFQVARVLRLRYDEPFHRKDDIIAFFSDPSIPPFKLSLDQFQKPRVLLSELRMQTRRNVNSAKRASTVAQLLYQIMEPMMETLDIPFFAGWETVVGNPTSFRFTRFFSRLTSHQPGSDMTYDLRLHDNWMQQAKIEADRYLDSLAPVDHAELRSLIFLVWHVGCLYSLLAQVDHPFQLGFSFLVDSPVCEGYLNALLSLYDDSAIFLSDPTRQFAEQLSLRKDQVAIINSSFGGGSSGPNTGLLTRAVQSGRIDQKNLLQALPVFVSRQVFQLVTDPCMVSIDSDLWSGADLPGPLDVATGDAYLQFFAPYTAERAAHLTDLITDGKVQARRLCPLSLTTAQVDAVGILIGVRSFLAEYLDKIGLRDRCDWILSCNVIPWLIDLIEEHNYPVADQTEVISSFVRTVRAMIAHGELIGVRVTNNCADYHDTDCEILYNAHRIFFPLSTLRRICSHMNIKKRQLVAVMRDNQLLLGSTASKEATGTRWKIYRANGNCKPVFGYALELKHFNMDFDPLFTF